MIDRYKCPNAPTNDPIYVLATFVDPWPRDMTQTVPHDKFLKR